MNKNDRNVMLENVAKQAYLMGLDDAPAIMGRRGRAVQLEGGRDIEDAFFHKTLIEWDLVKSRIAREVGFDFHGIPNEEL